MSSITTVYNSENFIKGSIQKNIHIRDNNGNTIHIVNFTDIVRVTQHSSYVFIGKKNEELLLQFESENDALAGLSILQNTINKIKKNTYIEENTSIVGKVYSPTNLIASSCVRGAFALKLRSIDLDITHSIVASNVQSVLVNDNWVRIKIHVIDKSIELQFENRTNAIEGARIIKNSIKCINDINSGPTYFDTGNAMTVLYPAQSIIIKDSKDSKGHFVAFQCTTPLSNLEDLDFECDLTIRNTGVKRANSENYPLNDKQNSADKIKVVFSTGKGGCLNDRKPMAHVESSLLDYKGKQIKVGIDAGKITIFVAYKGYNSESITATLDCVQVAGRPVKTEWNIFPWETPVPADAESSYIYHGSDKDLVRGIENIKAEFFHSRQSVNEYETDLLDDDGETPLAMIRTYGLGIKLSSWELLNFVDDGKFEFLIERYRPQKIKNPNSNWPSPEEAGIPRYGRAKYRFEPEGTNGRINVITASVGGSYNQIEINTGDVGNYKTIQSQGTYLYFNQHHYFLWEKRRDSEDKSFPVVKSYPRKYGRLKARELETSSICVSTAFCWLGFKLRFRLRGKEYVTRGHIGQIKMVAKAIAEIEYKSKLEEKVILRKNISCVISYKKG